jgi:hypothetical protein
VSFRDDEAVHFGAGYRELIREAGQAVASNPEKPQRLYPSNGVSDGPTPRRPDGGPSQAEPDPEIGVAKAVEFIGIPKWCRRVGCSRESGYRAARRDEIPGLFRIGRLKCINWAVFVNAAAQPSATEQKALRGY